jgi:hypothetical protein
MHSFVTRVIELPSRRSVKTMDFELPVETVLQEVDPSTFATAPSPFDFESDGEDALDQITLGFD